MNVTPLELLMMLAAYLVPFVIAFGLLYLVIKAAVRAGMREALTEHRAATAASAERTDSPT